MSFEHLKGDAQFGEELDPPVRPDSPHRDRKVLDTIGPAPLLLVLIDEGLPVRLGQHRIERDRQVDRLHPVVPMEIRQALPVDDRVFANHIDRPESDFHERIKRL